MQRTHFAGLLATVSATLLLAAGAAAQPAPLRAGLWEMTPQAGDPAQQKQLEESRKAMAQLPAAQRQAIEAALSQQGVQMAGNAIRMCLTKELLANASFVNPRTQGSCTTQQGPRTGQSQTFSYKCTQPPAEGEGTVTYQGDTGYTSRVTNRVAGQPPHTQAAQGRWVAADCGGLPPVQIGR